MIAHLTTWSLQLPNVDQSGAWSHEIQPQGLGRGVVNFRCTDGATPALTERVNIR